MKSQRILTAVCTILMATLSLVTAAPAVTSLTLVNTDNDTDIKTLAAGDVLDLAKLPTKNLSIRAYLNSEAVSVAFALSGAKIVNHTENISPYVLFGDVSGDIVSQPMGVGSYTIKATPYTLKGATGTAGAVDSVNFSITDSSTTPTVNSAPTVSLATPTGASSLVAPANVTLSATASDTDGSVTKVEFYNGSTLLGTDTTSPYTYQWNGVAAGKYSITAKAYDNQGASKVSNIISLIVNIVTSSTGVRTFYVSSSSGDDANPGTLSQPWKTIAKVNATTFAAGDHILFKNGDTFTGTLVADNDGNSTSRIVYGNYGPAFVRPVISGFKELTTWTASSKAGVYYSAMPTSPSIVLADGKLKGKGRFPKTTYNDYVANSDTSITDSTLPDSPSWVGAEIVVRSFTVSHSTVKSQSGGVITTTTPVGTRAGAGYFFENHMNALTAFGDWMYNATEGRFYMYFGSNGPNGHKIKVDTDIGDALETRSANYVTFENLIAEGFGNGLYAKTSQYNILQNCEIRYCGGGVCGDGGTFDSTTWTLTSPGACYLTIQKNYFHDLLNNGIRSASLTLQNWTIQDNKFENIGLMIDMASGSSTGCTCMYIRGDGHIIRRNTILNVGFIPIYLSSDKALVENNYINGFMLVKCDGGGIYSWNSDAEKAHLTGRTIRGNIIVNGSSAGGYNNTPTVRCAGLYSDQTDHITYESNVVVNVAGHGMHLLQGKYITLKGNIFSQFGTAGTSRYGINLEQNNSAAPITHASITGNVVLSADHNMLKVNPKILDTTPVPYPYSSIGTITGNTYRSGILKCMGWDWGIMKTLPDWQTMTGYDAGSTYTAWDATKETIVDYNETNSDQVLDLGSKTYLNLMTKATVTGKLTLKPYQSVALVQQ